MTPPSRPEASEIVRRIRSIDGGTLLATVGAFRTGAEAAADIAAEIQLLIQEVHADWQSDDGNELSEHLVAERGRWVAVETAFTEIAAHLRTFDHAVEDASVELRLFDHAVVETYMEADRGPEAEVYAGRASEIYHRAEHQLRMRLWEIGDSAPVGPPPMPGPPRIPRGTWWQRVLFGPAGQYVWRRGPDRQLLGFDEDGDLVPAHRGRPEFVEFVQSGIGGLLRKLPGIGRRFAGARPSLRELTEAFADDIVRSHGWRPEHIDRHIREWFHLADDAPVPPWMKQEFLKKVSHTAAVSGKVVPGRLVNTPTHAVLHFDQASKRFLIVHFHAEGKYAGQFATAFKPSISQIDDHLRRCATLRGM